jgi:hypothetical protein
MATFFGDESTGKFGGLEEAEISKRRLPPSLLCFCNDMMRMDLRGGGLQTI